MLAQKAKATTSAATTTTAATDKAPAAAASPAPAGPSGRAELPGQPKKRRKVAELSLSRHASSKAPAEIDTTSTALDDEVEKYEKICSTVDAKQYLIADGTKFDVNRFLADHKKVLPIHYRTYLGDCASKRAASASVESVYSGATKLSNEAERMADEMLAAYIFCHYNWAFEFLRRASRRSLTSTSRCTATRLQRKKQMMKKKRRPRRTRGRRRGALTLMTRQLRRRTSETHHSQWDGCGGCDVCGAHGCRHESRLCTSCIRM